MARMVVTAPEYTKAKYNLPMLKEIDEYVASVVEVNIPVSTFKHCIIYILIRKS
jgi:homocitrate synthase